MIPLLLAAFLMLSGNGLLSTTLSIRVAGAHASPWATLVVTAFSIGLIVGATLAPRVVHRVGHIRTFAALSALSTVFTLLMLLVPHPGIWALGRLVIGLCSGGNYVVLESWLTAASPAGRRSQTFAYYLSLCHLGLAFGQVMVGDGSGTMQEVLAASLYVLAIVPLSMTSTSQPVVDHVERASLWTVIRTAPVGILAGALAGIVTGAWSYAGGLIINSVAPERTDIGQLMSGLYLGGLLLQWPIGLVADRIDRRVVLQGLGVLLAAIHLLFYVLLRDERVLAPGLIALGAVLFIIYPVALAHTQDLAPEHHATGFSSTLLLSYGVGAIIGPAVFGTLAMYSPPLFFLAMASAGALLFLVGGARLVIKPHLHLDSQVPFQPVMVPFAGSAQELDPRTESHQLELPFQ